MCKISHEIKQSWKCDSEKLLLNFSKSSLNWSLELLYAPFRLRSSFQTTQLFTVYPKISELSPFVPLVHSVLIRFSSSSLLEFKQRQDYLGSGKENGEPGKEQWCGGKSWRSTGSAENRKAARKAIRIVAMTKPENSNIFAEVLIVSRRRLF